MLGHTGKVAGFAAGLLAGLLAGGVWLPVLLCLGLLAGALVDRRLDPDRIGPPERAPTLEDIEGEAHRAMARNVSAVLFQAGRGAGGELTDAQVEVAQRFLFDEVGLDEADKPEINRAFAEAQGDPSALAEACRACRETLDPAVRLGVVRALFRIASAEGSLSASASAVVQDAARRLGVAEEEVEAIREEFVEHPSEAYRTLGLDPDASVEEIKKAFRALASRHHPDRAAHLGPGAAERARRRFDQIQDAYSAIRRERGF